MSKDILNNTDERETVESVPYIVYEAAQARNERTVKRLVAIIITTIITAIVLIVVSNFVWIWYINQYDYASYEVSTDGGGDAYYNELVGDGQINYGESESEKAH